MIALPLLLLVLGSLAMLTIGWMGMTRKLPPNYIAGIRTPFTRRSPEHWYVTHEAAGAILILGSAAGIAGGMAFLPFVIAGVVGDALAEAVAIGIAVVLAVTVVAAWLYGTTKAKSVLARAGQG